MSNIGLFAEKLEKVSVISDAIRAPVELKPIGVGVGVGVSVGVGVGVE